MNRDINSHFISILENIDKIENDKFYENKQNIISIKQTIKDWFDYYKNNNSLKNIVPELLTKIDLIITDYFDIYITIEPIKNNYVERLLF